MDERPAAEAAADPASNSAARLWNTPVGNDPAFLLARANALSLSRIHDALSTIGLRARSYSLLAIVAADTRPSQRELSEFLQLDPSQIVSLIDALEARKLVRRKPDPRDRRAKVVVATAAGRTLAETARNIIIESDAQWFARIPKTEQEQLFSALRALAVE